MTFLKNRRCEKETQDVMDELDNLKESFDRFNAECDRATRYFRILTAVSIVASIIMIFF